MMAVQTNLSRKSMLVILAISRWTARKHDKKISEQVKQSNGANGNVGRFHKRLLPGDSETLESVRKIADETRDFHYSNTLPWGQDGSRILPKENYFPYMAQMREFRRRFDAATEAFVQEYPTLKVNAKEHLAQMFNEADYPTAQALRGKFGFDVNILPFPDADDFRVNLDADEESLIREAIDEQTNKAVSIAMRDIWTRLHDAVAKMAERLADPDNIFRDTMVTNLRELCDVLPRLNVANDPHLDDLCEQARTKLAAQNPQALRDNGEVRAKAAMDAQQITDMMRSYMGQ